MRVVSWAAVVVSSLIATQCTPEAPIANGDQSPAPASTQATTRSADARFVRLARIDGYGNPRTGELWMRTTQLDADGREIAAPSERPAAPDPETGDGVQVVTQALAGFCTVDVKADGVENSNPPGTFEFYTKGQLAGAPMSELSSFDPGICYGHLTQAEKDLQGGLLMTLFGTGGPGVGCAYQHVGNFSGRDFEHVYLDIDVFNGDEAMHGAYGAPFTTGTVDTPGGRNTPNANKGLWDFGPMTDGQLTDMWIYFKNGDSTDFNWTGYLLGEVHETCGNSVDDDCDGVVDNDCNDFALDAECYDDEDCGSGDCNGEVIVSSLGKGGADLEDDVAGTCVDCSNLNCAAGSTCMNTVDGYECVCDSGYEPDGSGGCADVDECATDNGGCGDAMYWQCTNNPGGPPTCGDLDECATDNGNCGDPAYWQCTNKVGASPSCTDVDECAVNNGGCGEAAYWSCTNNVGTAPTCADIDECLVDNGGCGSPTSMMCVNNPGADPDCTDIDECLVANGGCGPAAYWQCIDNFGMGPDCVDIDECATGNGGCGDPTYYLCSNDVGAPPTCSDIDECATNNGDCGTPGYVTCTNNVGMPPTCTDVDECATDNGGCGDPAYWQCTNVFEGLPSCSDIDECATDNGGCGDPAYWQCTNTAGGPPMCDDIDECAINNGDCGLAGYITCTNNPGAPPSCDDIDECLAGNGGCGPATYWSCTNNFAAPPSCDDIDECLVSNGGCGPSAQWVCNNQPGGPPSCSDFDECANGTDSCDDGGLCTNVPGSYTCSCPGMIDYAGDGSVCHAIVKESSANTAACAITSDGRLYCWGRNTSGQIGDGTFTDRWKPTEVMGNYTDWETVSVGAGQQSCGIRAGHLFCWGRNVFGQVGDGTSTTRTQPVEVYGNHSDWIGVTAGGTHTCGLREPGTMYCWGNNSAYQLGDGTNSPHNVPTAVSGGFLWTAASAGGSHTCGVSSTGDLYCWGSGFYGQLGDGTTGGSRSISEVVAGGIVDWQGVTSGTFHTCAWRTAGELYCWGAGAWGQLGDGMFGDRNTPVQVGGTWLGATAGGNHTCGVQGGRFFCWGNNDFGQVGDGSTDGRSTPVEIGGGFGDWTHGTAGGVQTCGLRSSGQMFCWGGNPFGELGIGTDANRSTPTEVSGASKDWLMASTSLNHSCGLRDGKAYCFGKGNNGSIGDGTSATRLIPVQEALGFTDWRVISTGGSGHTCGTRSNGRAYCWGTGFLGQLGDGGSVSHLVPTEVSGALTTWETISTGNKHTCGISTGHLYCWGDNSLGELGDGTLGSGRMVPSEVSGLYSDWSMVSSFNGHNCGIRNGRLFCWGANANGQLGNGSVSNANEPVEVDGGYLDWSMVAVGGAHTCGIRADSRLFCWGANSSSQLGDGGTDQRTVPVEVLGSYPDWSAVDAGGGHTCGVRGGRMFCWGANTQGQLGDGGNDTRPTPAEVMGSFTDWESVTTGDQQTCGVRNNQLYCWGLGAQGQLGYDPPWTPTPIIGP